MPISTISEQNRVVKILPRVRKALANMPGILSIEAGFRLRKGSVVSDQLGVTIYVTRKHERDLLTEHNMLLPAELFGLPLDVIAIQPDYQDLQRADPLIAGISIANAKFTSWGTVGCYVRDASQKVFGLSNYHVLVDNRKPFQKKGKIGDRINQPGLEADIPLNNVGTLTSFDKRLDCALFELSTTRQVEQAYAFANVVGPIGPPVAPIVGTLVKKVGAATELTYGIILSVGANGFTVGINNAKKPANDILSMGGDSGSVWVTDNPENNILGLHYGGDTKIALAYNITKVFDKLLVSL